MLETAGDYRAKNLRASAAISVDEYTKIGDAQDQAPGRKIMRRSSRDFPPLKK